jgi:hypothetical protein
MADPKLKAGTLYVLRERDFRSGSLGSYVKVGLVRDLPAEVTDRDRIAERVREHQTGNAREIVVEELLDAPMVEELETQLHHRFASRRVNGEWFELDAERVRSELTPAANRLIAQQTEALPWFEARRELCTLESNGCRRPPDELERELWQRAVHAKETMTLAKAKKELIDRQLRAHCSGRGINGVATFRLRPKNPGMRFDKTAFTRAHPDLVEQFTVLKELKVTGAVRLSGASTLRSLDLDLYSGLARANEMLPELVLQQLDEQPAPRDQPIEDLHGEYLKALTTTAAAGWDEQRLIAQLSARLGEDEGIEGMISWKRVAAPKKSFDEEALKAAYPDLWKIFFRLQEQSVVAGLHFYRPYAL